MIAERLPGRAALGKLGLGRGERKATLQQLIPVRIKTFGQKKRESEGKGTLRQNLQMCQIVTQ